MNININMKNAIFQSFDNDDDGFDEYEDEGEEVDLSHFVDSSASSRS